MHSGGGSRRDIHRMARSSGSRSATRRSDVETTTLEEVPTALQDQLEDLLEQEEEIKIAISTDLQVDGTYGKDWVLATDNCMAITS